MVGLQAYAEVAGQADGVAKARHHLAFAGGKDQILIAHQLTDRRRHLRGDGAGDPLQRGGIGSIIQQPVAKIADRQVTQGGKALRIMGVEDQASHFVLLVRDKRVIENVGQRHLGEGHFRRHPLFG